MTVSLVVLVCVQFSRMEEFFTGAAPIVVGAAAMDLHQLAREVWARVETTPAPVAAIGAPGEPAGHAIGVSARQHDGLFECCGPPALR